MHERLAGAQLQLTRNELFRGRFRAARDISFALLVIGLLVAIAIALASAAASRAIVVQPFSVPPELARRGLTGEVVAQRFLDQLLHVQGNADSIRAPASFADSWSGDLAVQIPSTGVSLGEAHRMLRRWLGNETYIVGEVLVQGDRLRIAARAAGSPPAEAGGTVDDFDAVLRRTAEGVFAQQQPYLFAIYVADQGRRDLEVQILTNLSRTGPPGERAWAFNALGWNASRQERLVEAMALFRTAIRLNPELPSPHHNVAMLERFHGRDGALAERLPVAREYNWRAARRGEVKGEAAAANIAASDIIIAELAQDHRAAEAAAWRSLHLINYNNSRHAAAPRLALSQAALHRRSEARQTLAAYRLSPAELARESNMVSAGEETAAAYIRIAVEDDDWGSVLRQAEGLDRWQLARGGLDRTRRPVFAQPWIARARAELGDIAGAWRTIAPTPPDCSFCLRVRGRITALARRTAESERWYRAAAATAPSLPAAYHEWAVARLLRGDASGAIELARDAVRRGPQWADPRKLWGDALGRQGEHREAARQYAAAAERAPRWGALHINWGLALWQSGRHGEAREKWRAAAGMDLSRRDRAWLERIFGRTNG